MSRIGKEPITVPEDVTVNIKDKAVDVQGKLGALKIALPSQISAKLDSGKIIVERDNDSQESKSLHGLNRSLISNMVVGVSKGFQKDLEINGVGYRAEMNGAGLKLSLGYSHPIDYPLPKEVKAAVDGRKTKITLTSHDKQLLGVVAAKIRSFRKPEPYRGKGIKYATEVIKRKEGKSAGK